MELIMKQQFVVSKVLLLVFKRGTERLLDSDCLSALAYLRQLLPVRQGGVDQPWRRSVR